MHPAFADALNDDDVEGRPIAYVRQYPALPRVIPAERQHRHPRQPSRLERPQPVIYEDDHGHDESDAGYRGAGGLEHRLDISIL
jgi:hypothetical protein